MRNFNRIFYFFIIIAFFSASNTSAKGSAQTAGNLLLEPLSPKFASLSGAGSALIKDSALLNSNPAGMYGIEKTELSAMFYKGFSGDYMANFLIAKDLYIAILALAVVHYDTGKIDMYDTTGKLITKTGQKDTQIIIGSAEQYKDFLFGINLKFISSEIFGENAFAFGADFGMIYNPVTNLNLALSLQNFGSKLAYFDYKEDLPTLIKPAVSWTYDMPFRKITLVADMPYYINSDTLDISYGIIFTFSDRLSIIFGDSKGLSNRGASDVRFNVGWVLDLGNFKIEHSVAQTRNLDIPQRFSVSTRF